jgi:tetratricopeptide (TPR) repeat protein
MSKPNEPSLWFIDDDLVQALLAPETGVPSAKKRPAKSSALARAVELHRQGASEKALAELAGAAQAGEDVADALLLTGQIQFELGQFEQAAESYARLAEAAPGHRAARFNHGVCMARLGRWPEAAADLEKAVEVEPGRTEAWFGLGVCLLRHDRAAEAKLAFDHCLKLHPDHASAVFGQAVTLHMEGNCEQALAVYRRLLETQPNSEELLSNAIGAAVELRQAALVTELADRLFRLRPQSRAALLALASIAIEKGDFRQAASRCARLAESAPDSFEDWYNLGVCYQRIGWAQQAVQAFQSAARIKAGSLEAKKGLAAALTAGSDRIAARRAWEAVLAAAPGDADALAHLAYLADECGDKATAEQYCGKVLELAPGREETWFRLGSLRLERGDHAGSVYAFEQCLELKPDWADAARNLGVAHRRLGDGKAAVAAFEKALDLEPGNLDVLRSLAALAVERGDIEAAEKYRQKLDGAAWEVSYNLALLEQNQGALDKAAQLYRETLDQKPDCAEALINLGHVLKAQGHEPEAKECWQQALKAHPDYATRYFESRQ